MTPKQRILSNSALTTDIKALLSSAHFETASEAALHEFVMNQNRGNEGASAIASHFELEGAKRFLSYLKAIADVPQRTLPIKSGQLDHDMKPPTPEKK